MPNAYIIIPAYNEEGNLPLLLDDLISLQLPVSKKIVLVDDGSRDKTLDIARQYQGKIDMEIIIHEVNAGIPKTFYDGLKKASELAEEDDAIFIIEGDCTSDLNIMPQMIDMIRGGSDIVVASRYIKGGKYKNFPFIRTLGSGIVNIVLKIFFKTNGVTDYTIFYRGYSARIIKKAFEKYQEGFITQKSFAANLEVLLKVREFSNRNSEVPLVYDYGLKKGKSKMKLFKTLGEYRSLILKRIVGRSLW
jgi:dolichol-phosphate mannosyltransferase|tara:strand:- start:841 stop:1584 length:744 start_codon:yes stop_codon:yes gene_type:complete